MSSPTICNYSQLLLMLNLLIGSMLFSLCRHHGAHERSRGCSEMHQQCWETWETPGPHQALLQGHCALPNRHDEARWVIIIRQDLSKNLNNKDWDAVWWRDRGCNSFSFWWRSLKFLMYLSLFLPPGYIGEFEIIDDHRAGKIVVNLTGRLNKVRPVQTNVSVNCAFSVILF